MAFEDTLQEVLDYFHGKLTAHGPTPQGVDWNSPQSQKIRFEQIVRIIDPKHPFTILDYGCGYGGLVNYLDERDFQYEYTGYDPLDSMIVKAQECFGKRAHCQFIVREETLQPTDYVVASGIFNVKLNTTDALWTEYCLCLLQRMHELSHKGFSFNMLTKYSDTHKMRPELYYGDPLFLFDYCKNHFSRNVALLHDYGLYDFTILVRKEAG
jgi:SAM-dependent methyltransferase